MGMTEKQGGSDVRANTTRAIPCGTDGDADSLRARRHKWFTSAPMCDAFLMLAQAARRPYPAFLVPRWRPDGGKNGIELHALKPKDGKRVECLVRDRARQGIRLAASATKGTRRKDHHRDGGDDAASIAWLDRPRASARACPGQSPRRSPEGFRRRRSFISLLMRNVLADLQLEVGGLARLCAAHGTSARSPTG
jgi:putative acyl-CoA dehydrogenase